MLTTDFTGAYDYEMEEAHHAAQYIIEDYADGYIDCAIDLFEDAYIKHKDEHTVTLVINREIWDMLESFCKS